MSAFIQNIHWSNDLTSIHKGETVVSRRTILMKGKPVEQVSQTFVPTRYMALTSCGKVVPTYWVMPQTSQHGGTLDAGDRWSGFTKASGPVAIAAWPDAKELAPVFRAEQVPA